MKKLGDDAPISTHYIQTKKAGWKEVEKQDRFFAKTRLIETHLAANIKCVFVCFSIC